MIPVIYGRIKTEISKFYIGNRKTIRALCVGLLTGGHVLIEGVPGLAKTTLARGLAEVAGSQFKRIQFTADLMPADITGSNVYRMDTGKFKFIEGPVFTNILLADEINRAPARTQGALLEAMQEHHVTVDGECYPLPDPFFVIATQNPLEERGTYPLPESQMDRFMFRIRLGYPTEKEEKQIVMQATLPEAHVDPVLLPEDFVTIREQLANIRVSDSMIQYITDLIRQTRLEPEVERGASPRAGAMLLRAARGYALLRQSEFVTPDDVQEALPYVLNHRLVLVQDDIDVDVVIEHIHNHVSFK